MLWCERAPPRWSENLNGCVELRAGLRRRSSQRFSQRLKALVAMPEWGCALETPKSTAAQRP